MIKSVLEDAYLRNCSDYFFHIKSNTAGESLYGSNQDDIEQIRSFLVAADPSDCSEYLEIWLKNIGAHRDNIKGMYALESALSKVVDIFYEKGALHNFERAKKVYLIAKRYGKDALLLEIMKQTRQDVLKKYLWLLTMNRVDNQSRQILLHRDAREHLAAKGIDLGYEYDSLSEVVLAFSPIISDAPYVREALVPELVFGLSKNLKNIRLFSQIAVNKNIYQATLNSFCKNVLMNLYDPQNRYYYEEATGSTHDLFELFYSCLPPTYLYSYLDLVESHPSFDGVRSGYVQEISNSISDTVRNKVVNMRGKLLPMPDKVTKPRLGTMTFRNDAEKQIIENLFYYGFTPDIFPPELQLDITDECMYKRLIQQGKPAPFDCNNCSYGDEDGGETLAFGAIEDIVKKYSLFGGRYIWLTGGGEPGEYEYQSSRYFEDVLGLIVNAGMSFGFNTNGKAFERLNGLSDTELGDLFVHTSYLDNPLMMSFSVHDVDYMEAFEGLLSIKKRLRTMQLNNLLFRASFLVHDESETSFSDIDLFYSRAKEFGLDVGVIKPAYHRFGSGLAFSKNRIDGDEVQFSFSDPNDSFVVQQFRMNRMKQEVSFDRVPYCYAPFMKMHVASDGDIYMCCDTKKDNDSRLFYGFPDTPYEYYSTLLGKLLEYKGHSLCSAGCNWHEFNSEAFDRLGNGAPLFPRYFQAKSLSQFVSIIQ